MSVHSREKTFKCYDCDAAFARQYDLNSHIRVHTGELPYTCLDCGVAFRQEGHLRSHSRTHLRVQNKDSETTTKIAMMAKPEKPFACDQCDAKFSRNFVLKNHMLVHSGERPHKCADCGATFAQKCNMLTHSRIHTGVAPYKCDECGAAFAQKSSLRAHSRTHGSKKEYKCETCAASFARKYDLIMHFSQTHARTYRRRTRVKSLYCVNEPKPADSLLPTSGNPATDELQNSLGPGDYVETYCSDYDTGWNLADKVYFFNSDDIDSNTANFLECSSFKVSSAVVELLSDM